MTRTTSCYCTGCLTKEDFCEGWQQHTIQFGNQDVNLNENLTSQINLNSNDISVEEFAAAVYQGDWYIGKVCDIDHEDKEIEISFLQMRKMAYQ